MMWAREMIMVRVSERDGDREGESKSKRDGDDEGKE